MFGQLTESRLACKLKMPEKPPRRLDQVEKTGHWKATGRILGKFLWNIDYKNLEIMYPPL